jgi:hypothetical protein
MRIDDVMPHPDARRVEHRIVDGDPDAVYAAALHADLVDTWRHSLLLRFLFRARDVGERAVAVARRRAHVTPPPPATLRLEDLPTRGEWVRLIDDPPHEFVFGTAGRFWAGETAWDEIDADAFATYDRPQRARIAACFRFTPLPGSRTLVEYECRTQATDAPSRRAFLRYWRALSPFIGLVLRAQLRTIEPVPEPTRPVRPVAS